MLPFKIGNWLIDDEGITWDAEPIAFFISKSSIADSESGDRVNCYNWMLHVASLGWLKPTDVYQFNTAFVYALESYKMNLTEQSFIKTLALQQKLIVKLE